MSAVRARALQLSARLEARLSGAHTRPGHGAVPCARRECRCAARGRPRRQEGHLRPLATAWGARAQREPMWCAAWPLSGLGPPRGARGAPSCSSGPGATPPRRLRSPPGRGERRRWRLAPRRRSWRLGPRLRAAREAPKGCCCSSSDPVCTAQPGADAPGRTAVGLARLAPLPGAAQGAPGPPSARTSRLVRA